MHFIRDSFGRNESNATKHACFFGLIWQSNSLAIYGIFFTQFHNLMLRKSVKLFLESGKNFATFVSLLFCSAYIMGFNQSGDVSTLYDGSLKLVAKFTNLKSSVSFIENVINTQLVKAWTAIYWLAVIWKSDLSDKIKCNFFLAAAVWILLFRYTTWRCTWCNGYRRRKWTRRYEFKSWTRLIAFHIALIPLGKVWIQ